MSLSVAVLVDLFRTPSAGGQVKSWERLAEAAGDFAGEFDLTIYVLGEREETEPVSGNARFVSLRPLLSTAPLHAIAKGADSTDLAPWHPALARRLPWHHVWHATMAFAFGWTARRLAPRIGHPLVVGLQTNVPAMVGDYLRQFLGARLGPVVGDNLLLTGLRLDALAARAATAHERKLLQAARHILVLNESDRAAVTQATGQEHVSRFRLGLDTHGFRPGLRDPEWIRSSFRIERDEVVVLFVGRVDATKRVLTLAEAIRILRSEGLPAHLLVAGAGSDLEPVAALLGSDATLPGALDPRELARVYASADVFAFPSVDETSGAVVAEAMASGLPVVLQKGAATNEWLRDPGSDGFLVEGKTPAAWAAALRPLVTDGPRRQTMGRAARESIVRSAPTWEQVLAEDLLPVWRAVSGRWTFAGGPLTLHNGSAPPHCSCHQIINRRSDRIPPMRTVCER